MKRIFIFVIFISSTLVSCAKFGEDHHVNVYVAGKSARTIGDWHPVYWHNGVRKDLSNGFFLGFLNDISVSGGHVYTVGEFDSKPVYWTDDQPHFFNDSLAWVYSIATLGNDVFVAGAIPVGKTEAAAYWKNGVLEFSASDSSNYSIAYSMTISGGDVYLAGWKSGKTIYWKNGNEVPLEGKGYLGVGNVIAVSGDDVYVAGNIYDTAALTQLAGYWKNGQWIAITDATGYAQTNGIAVSSNDVYVVGTYSAGVNASVYWKNGKMNVLSEKGEAVAIKVVGTDMYVAGTLQGVGGYWKNGTWTAVSSPGERVEVTAIDVQ